MNLKQKCEDLKIKGNEAFKKKDYKKSISFYTEAIEYEPTAILQLQPLFRLLKLNKSWFKEYLRKAVQRCTTRNIQTHNSLNLLKKLKKKLKKLKN
jgi:hypothetical protein